MRDSCRALSQPRHKPACIFDFLPDSIDKAPLSYKIYEAYQTFFPNYICEIAWWCVFRDGLAAPWVCSWLYYPPGSPFVFFPSLCPVLQYLLLHPLVPLLYRLAYSLFHPLLPCSCWGNDSLLVPLGPGPNLVPELRSNGCAGVLDLPG